MNLENNHYEKTEAPDTKTFLEFLGRIEEITEVEIMRFREKIPEESQIIFDEDFSPDKKILVVFFDTLTDEELEKIRQLERTNGKLAIIHDLNNILACLFMLTNNRRYLRPNGK